MPKAPNPTVAVMVKEAIEEADDKKGCSIQAIKKHIVTNYGGNITQLGPFIKRFLKDAVDSGELVQVTGKGALGSFKLGKGTAKPKKRVTTQAVADVAVKAPEVVVPSQATSRVTRAAKKAETSAAGPSKAPKKQPQPQTVSKKKAEAKAVVEKKAPPKVVKSAGEKKASRGGKKAAPKKQ